MPIRTGIATSPVGHCRRHLKDGQLRGEREETAQGFRWCVLLDHEDDPSPQTVTHEDASG